MSYTSVSINDDSRQFHENIIHWDFHCQTCKWQFYKLLTVLAIIWSGSYFCLR